MNEQQEETINIKTSTQKTIKRKYLTPFQKLILSLLLIIIFILLTNINILEDFYSKELNINNNQIKNKNKKENVHTEIHSNKNNKEHNLNPHKLKINNLKIISEEKINQCQSQLEKDLNNKNLSEINKKRTFEKRYPLPKEIQCKEHVRDGGLLDMMVFLSYLTKNTTFFEFASGCSTIIAKYFTKKAYAVEGNIKWYNIGVENGLKDILLFKDLKCDGTGPLLSYPGKHSTLNDWKNFFQAYKKEYEADVILIDGRFRVACALDIFDKIKNDTAVLLHECKRKEYSIIKNYYNLIYQGGSLCVYIKKSNISEIPLDIQMKYWNQKV